MFLLCHSVTCGESRLLQGHRQGGCFQTEWFFPPSWWFPYFFYVGIREVDYMGDFPGSVYQPDQSPDPPGCAEAGG